MKMNFGAWLLQIVPVMLGVYLAFVISNWNEDRKTRSEFQIFESALIEEIENNKKQLEQVIDYHQMLRDTCKYYINNDLDVEIEPDFFKGIRTSRLAYSVFDTGKQTGLINQFSVDRINLTNRIYNRQAQYNEFTMLVLEALISQDFSKDADSIKKVLSLLSMTMQDIVWMESHLIQNYEKLLEELK